MFSKLLINDFKQTIQLIKELILHVSPLITFPPPLYLLLIPYIKLISPKKEKKEIFKK